METKPPITISQQVELLKSRGCIIDDEFECSEFLSRVNYYRLSAYFLPFLDSKTDSYVTGTNFSRICRIYNFDQILRMLLLSVIEDIEVFVRTQVAYYCAHKYDPLGYEDAINFNNRHDHAKFIAAIESEVKRNENVLFVKHHIKKYNGKLPIWVAVELFSFGTLSRFFSDLKLPDQKILAKEMFGLDNRIIRSWLHCGTGLRNICAHYGRLYFRELGALPLTPKKFTTPFDRSLFSSIVMLMHMYPDIEKWNLIFTYPLEHVFSKYENVLDTKHMGFPDNWREILAQKK